MSGFVYLIQPELLIGTEKYKIGMSEKKDLSRMSSYGKNKIIYYLVYCIKPKLLENKLIQKFNQHFKLIYGREYFEGKIFDMIKEFHNLVINYNNETKFYGIDTIIHTNKPVKKRKTNQIINDIQKILKSDNNKDKSKSEYNDILNMFKNEDDIKAQQFIIDTRKIEKLFEEISNIKTRKELYKDYYEAINCKKIIKKNHCRWCLKILSSTTNYKKHIRSEICLEDELLRCYICGCDFKCKQNLDYHLNNAVCLKHY